MADELPWREGTALLDVIREWDPPEELTLPDEKPASPSEIRWSPGSWEGVATRHFGIGEDERAGLLARVKRRLGRDRDPAAEAVARLKALAHHPGDTERLRVYRFAQNEAALDYVDTIIDRVGRDPALRPALAPHAQWLVADSRHRGPLKLGITLLGLSGNESDLDALQTLARHAEFTLYCVVAIQNLVPDPVDELWEVAKSADGWGKIETVERLAPLVGDRPDIQRWLLTHGCENAAMHEYLGYVCATAGHLADALAGEVDDELLDGACVIASALQDEGAASGLDDYEEGPVAIPRLIRHLDARCTTLDRLITVGQIGDSVENLPHSPELGWTDELRTQVLAECRAILDRPAWPPAIRDEYESAATHDDAARVWIAARYAGVDLWEAAFNRLPTEWQGFSLICDLMQTHDLERRRRVIEWVGHHVPLDELPKKPEDRFFADESYYALDAAVAFTVQEMGDGQLYSERLVAAAIRCPVTGTRSQGLRAMAATPRAQWGELVERALEQLKSDEPDDELRQRACNLASR